MKMKKVLVIVLALVLAIGCISCFTACNKNDTTTTVKFGLITLHDESSTYDKNFIDAAKAVCQEMGIELITKRAEEDQSCYQAAADLVDQGCNIVFADSFGHEDYIIKAAKEFKDVQFFHATGTKAHTEKLANYHNAFANIYEGRFLAGVAAGMKLAAMKAANPATASKIGYVGAFTYAEVMSGYTSYYLGVKSIVPDVTMDVTFTGSWYDPTAEKQAATTLINNGCVLISQHADSMGAPTACQEKNVPNVTYNVSTKADTPTTYLIGSKINWGVYYKYIIEKVQKGESIEYDWVGGIDNGAVQLTELNTAVAAAGTAEKIEEMKAKLASGEVKVFDVAKDNYITKNGVKMTSYMADVDDTKGADGKSDFNHETEVISGGVFQESKFRSAPYFDAEIDGITLLDRNYGD